MIDEPGREPEPESGHRHPNTGVVEFLPGGEPRRAKNAEKPRNPEYDGKLTQRHTGAVEFESPRGSRLTPTEFDRQFRETERARIGRGLAQRAVFVLNTVPDGG